MQNQSCSSQPSPSGQNPYLLSKGNLDFSSSNLSTPETPVRKVSGSHAFPQESGHRTTPAALYRSSETAGQHNLLEPSISNFPPLPCKGNPNPNTQQTGSQWAHLFSFNRLKDNGLNLEFIAPEVADQRPTITFTHEEVEEELNRWENALVGYVLGAKPPYKLMKQYVE